MNLFYMDTLQIELSAFSKKKQSGQALEHVLEYVHSFFPVWRYLFITCLCISLSKAAGSKALNERQVLN